MTYIRDNQPSDHLTSEIQNKVIDARHSGKLYSSYIKEQQNAMLLAEKAKAEGEAKGEAKGKIETMLKNIRNLLNNGFTAEKITELFALSDEEAKMYFGKINGVSINEF